MSGSRGNRKLPQKHVCSFLFSERYCFAKNCWKLVRLTNATCPRARTPFHAVLVRSTATATAAVASVICFVREFAIGHAGRVARCCRSPPLSLCCCLSSSQCIPPTRMHMKHHEERRHCRRINLRIILRPHS